MPDSATLLKLRAEIDALRGYVDDLEETLVLYYNTDPDIMSRLAEIERKLELLAVSAGRALM
jgi:hypothetical protein